MNRHTGKCGRCLVVVLVAAVLVVNAAPFVAAKEAPDSRHASTARAADALNGGAASTVDTSHGNGARSSSMACDIVVAGGSTASLAAAITAAEAAPHLTVCFTEITDWPGGQMSAGGVPAIDFGGSNVHSNNWPSSFASAMQAVGGATNLGACTVSTKCYEPQRWVEEWVMPRLAASPNLHVLLRAAVVDTQRDASTGGVTAVTVVQRTPRNPSTEWNTLLSQNVNDWYSPEDSDAFTKESITLTGKVFIEATEFADVLATGGFNFTQGVEIPTEQSGATDSTCGQVWTTTYYMGLLADPAAKPDPAPKGSDEGLPFAAPWGAAEWMHSWIWRRSQLAPGGNSSRDAATPNVGDVTQQNLLNDLDSGYPFLPADAVRAQAASASGWRGGLNLTVMSMLEGRAYGSFWYMVNTSSVVPLPAGASPLERRLVLNRTVSGTGHGLSKFPYVRDSRRGYGLDGYRFLYTPTDYFNASDPSHGEWFYDTVALGNYNDDVHHLHTCTYPDYMAIHTTKPYYIPFRALTVGEATNLLVAGKTLSQSFHANGATRLHPSEWTTGVAAGGTAALMVQRGWSSTRDALDNIAAVRSFLNSSSVGQPLQWAGTPSPVPIGYVCGLDRCFSTPKQVPGRPLHHNDTCDGNCSPLGEHEWLAESSYWALSADAKSITAIQSTILKKSIAMSWVLPPSEIKSVAAGTKCTLVDGNTTKFQNYWLCTV